MQYNKLLDNQGAGVSMSLVIQVYAYVMMPNKKMRV